MKNGKMKGKFNQELSRLSSGFNALNIDYKKGVLKTAQGLLKIQKANKKITTSGAGYSVSFGECAK